MGLVQDLRLVFRSLGRKPGFLAIAVLALTLGVGIPTTMYSILNGVLRNLPFEDAESILYVGSANARQGFAPRQARLLEYRYWQEHQTTFEPLSAYREASVSLSGDALFAERMRAAFLSPDLLEMLRVGPMMGRGFGPRDAASGAPDVAILAHSLWINRFEADPDILGKRVRIDGRPRTVIGVMPEGFRFPAKEVVWMPLILDRQSQDPVGTLHVVGRLAQGASISQARAEFEALSLQIEEIDAEEQQGTRAAMVPFTEERMGDVAPILYTMMTVVSFVLLVACANVANLLLARALSRNREIAVRSALGAGRKRIASMVLSESFVIAGLGGLIGIAVAYLGVLFFNRGIADMRADMAFWIDVRVDLPTLLFAVGMVLLGSLAAGAVPAWRASRMDVQQILQQESRTGSLRMGRFSRVLLAGQITLSCALLTISCLMIKGVIQLKTFQFDLPFARILNASFELPETLYPTIADRQRFYERLEREMVAQPSVERVALASTLPGRGNPAWPVEIEGQRTAESTGNLPLTSRVAVSGQFFSLLEAPVLAGRNFDPADNQSSSPVAIVNQAFAKRFFPGKNPLGKRLTLGRDSWKQPPRTIVGVVPNLEMVGVELNQSDADGVYVPLGQSSGYRMDIMVRSANPLALANLLRETVRGIDPDLPVTELNRLDRTVLEDKALLEVFGVLFLLFGSSALFLASVGLYSIVAFSVQQRVREMGIRRALGAAHPHILAQALRAGAIQVVVGIVLGLSIAALLSPVLAEGFFQTDPHDPVVFLFTALFLGVCGLAACLGPVRKALRTSPIEALRCE